MAQRLERRGEHDADEECRNGAPGRLDLLDRGETRDAQRENGAGELGLGELLLGRLSAKEDELPGDRMDDGLGARARGHAHVVERPFPIFETGRFRIYSSANFFHRALKLARTFEGSMPR